MKIAKSNSHMTALVASAFTSFCTLFYLAGKYSDKIRYDGIPSEQKMTLTKKEVVERSKIDNFWNKTASSHCLKLSFDTDGNTNTTEIIAYPGPYEGTEKDKDLKIGTQKTLKEWDSSLPLESKGLEPLEWLFRKKQVLKLVGRED